MRKFHPELYLINIIVSIDKIMRNTKNISYEEFVENETVFGFVTRELQEIGESVNKLLKGGFFSDESNEKWKKVVNFRNIVVHRYFGVHPEIVWEVIKKDIPQLEQETLDLMKQYEKRALLLQAISDTKKVYAKLNRRQTIAYLERIETFLEPT